MSQNVATKNKFIQVSRYFKDTFNLILVIFTAILLACYLFLPNATLSHFSQWYSDFVFLSFVISAVFLALKNTDSLVDPIYWILLAGAFLSWFAISVLKITLWDKISIASTEILRELAYFLFFALMIAAIEVKNYTKAHQLLALPNLLIWGASLSFTLGAFIFLILTNNNQTSNIHYSFVFYILMDTYLILRWFNLAWVHRKTDGITFSLFGLAFCFWFSTDLLEALHYSSILELKHGTFADWLWYIPYLLILLGLRINSNPRQMDKLNHHNFSNTHFLNSPIFFVISCFLLEKLITNNPQWFSSLSAIQSNFFNLWLSIGLIFSAMQLIMLHRSEKNLKNEIFNKQKSIRALELRMQQQAQSLKAQAASNKAILETTHNAMFTLNYQDIIQSCNPAASELIGIAESAMIGKPFIEITQAQGELNRLFTYQSYRQKLLNSNEGIEVEATITTNKNKALPVHASVSPDKSDQEGLIVISLINIQEQKLAEQQALKLKDEFAQNISHEFRTPLTIINGVIDNLLSHLSDHPIQEQLKTAKRNALRMIKMVEQLLELSRIANDPIKISTFNIAPLVKFVCASFEEIAKNQKLEFTYNIPKEAWVNGSSQAAEKICFNLISNAFKYTLKGRVKVELSLIDQKFQLLISDTGVGIASEELKQIFQRFHRVKNKETERVQGVGIGLALVHELCQSMKWEITVNSKPNKGSTFKLLINQAVEQHEASINTAQITTAQPALSKSIQQNLKIENIESSSLVKNKPLQKSKNAILIVEDNPDMLAHINEVLSPHHQCLLADNGKEGLRLAMDYLPDIVVSDVMMPEINGFQLLKTLKKTSMTSHIPVILLTARSDSESKLKGLEHQADDYLNKPFNAKELALRVNNLLNSRAKLQSKLMEQLQLGKNDAEHSIKDPFIDDLEKIFEKNYENSNYSVLDLANEMAMSDRQIQRKIKSVLGTSPLDAIKQFRLQKAKAMLESGETIGLVAQSCGFTSQSYFGRCFKESYGVTPTQFQKSF